MKEIKLIIMFLGSKFWSYQSFFSGSPGFWIYLFDRWRCLPWIGRSHFLPRKQCCFRDQGDWCQPGQPGKLCLLGRFAQFLSCCWFTGAFFVIWCFSVLKDLHSKLTNKNCGGGGRIRALREVWLLPPTLAFCSRGSCFSHFLFIFSLENANTGSFIYLYCFETQR